NSGRPSEWPKPGRSIATTRETADTRSQIRRYAQRLSGHGLSINTVTGDESALLSAKQTRTPSQTRNSGEMGEGCPSVALIKLADRLSSSRCRLLDRGGCGANHVQHETRLGEHRDMAAVN